MASTLKLDEMLNEHWLNAIGDLISAQPNAAKYLGISRDSATIPERKLTFTSLNQLPPKDINVVIFGQDPYPRAQSAIGVAFNDGAIHKWTDAMNPSFKNIIKNVLYGEGALGIDDGVDVVRKILARDGVAQPPDWFKHTIGSGVCWLNTSLTFTSTDTTVLAQHLQFWKPIVEGIIEALIDAKRALVKSGQTKAGLVFVLWGGHAQKLKKMVEKLNKAKSPAIDLQFVEAPHPAANGTAFHTVKSFASVNSALTKLGLPVVDWLPKGGVSASTASSSSSAPSASAKKTAKATAKASTSTTADEEKPEGKKATAAKLTAKRTAKPSVVDDEHADASDYSNESEEAAAVPKRGKKATAAKKATASGKKATAAAASKKRAKATSDSDDDESFEDEKPPKSKRAKR